MNPYDLSRPDKLLLKGFKSLSDLSQNLYSSKRSQAKARAELTFIGEKKMEEVRSQLYSYNKENISTDDKIKDFKFLKEADSNSNHWLNFHGIHDVNIIQSVGETIDLDRLTLRQILDTTLRPKVEQHDHYLFLSVKSILKEETGELNVEQISFVLGTNYVVSFQEEVGDHFGDIRNKMKEGLGFIRHRNSDYLLAQLLDAILDNYFETIDVINSEVLVIENQLLKNPRERILLALEGHTKSSQLIKKSLAPFKEVLQNLINTRSELIREGNLKYYLDLNNSVQTAYEEVDQTLTILDSLKNIYFAQLSQKMNEIMKVLTLVATTFIPLTFIAGIYGMNFDVMPELRNPNGYFITLGVMGGIGLAMLIYFRFKKWL